RSGWAARRLPGRSSRAPWRRRALRRGCGRARERRQRRVFLHVRRLAGQRLPAVGLDGGLVPLLLLPPLLPPLHDRADVLALRTRHFVSTPRGNGGRTYLIPCTASSRRRKPVRQRPSGS